MKQDILKIAGVKDEKSFYKKFPSEEAFMKVHGKEFKKAKMGAAMVKKQLTQLTDFANPPQAKNGIESTSVVDYLNSKGEKYDFNTRKKLAEDYNIKNYKGTVEQNLKLLDKLKSGAKSTNKTSEASYNPNDGNILRKGYTEPTFENRDVSFKTGKENKPSQNVKSLQNKKVSPVSPKESSSVYNIGKLPESRNLESGVIIDKGTNTGHIIKGNKIVNSFPVLTGQSRDSNENTKDLNYLESHPEERATPIGSYQMRPSNIYGNAGFNLDPISAYGDAAPKAKNIAEHVTYPGEFQKRNALYNQPADKRNASYGCINCKKPDIDRIASTFPSGDTTLIIDSRKNQDKKLLSKMSSGFEMGGYISQAQEGQKIGSYSSIEQKQNPNMPSFEPTMVNYQQPDALNSLGSFVGKMQKAQKGWHSEWDQNPLSQYEQPSEEDIEIERINNINLQENPMKIPAIKEPPLSKFQQGWQNIKKEVEDEKDTLPGKIIDGVQQIRQDRQNELASKQGLKVSDVSLRAAESPVEKVRRKYVRPEDMSFAPNQMGNPYGTGYNPLARDGAEIQNTYYPNDIYTDGGYEPLYDSENMKQFDMGGFMKKVGSQKAGDIGQFAGSWLGGGKGQTSGAGQLGSTLGGTVGSAFGPLGKIAGSAIGGAIGGVIGGAQAKRTAGNITGMQNNMFKGAMTQNIGNQMRNQYSAFAEDGMSLPMYEEGGWMNPEYNPQVITKFGDYDVKDLLSPDPMMDTLRAGGNISSSPYIQPSERAMQTYAMGGELQTHWGGHAEPISYNPYLPDGGETVMFRGQSHDETNSEGKSGIGVTYGDNPVEVERGEPAVKLRDGGDEENLVVFGNMKIPKYGVQELQDRNAEGKKFKHYANHLSKIENKQNKTIEKSLKMLDNLDENNPFDQLKLASAQANINGSNMVLKDIAQKKQLAAGIQNAILDTAKENGLESDALSRGIIKQDRESEYARNGIQMAQNGTSLSKKFDNVKEKALKKAQALYPGKKVEVRETSGDRDINTQAGFVKTGASTTDVSVHNFGGAKDFAIYVDGKFIKDPSVYNKTLHAAAKEEGLNPLNWKKDPYHISAVKEGGKNTFATLLKQYPDLLQTEQAKKSLAYLESKAKSDTLSPKERTVYGQLTGKDVSKLKATPMNYAKATPLYPNSPYEFDVPTTPQRPELPIAPIDYKRPPRDVPVIKGTPPPTLTTPPPPGTTPPKGPEWWESLIPYIRPTDQEPLDPTQLYPEMASMAMNTLEPVQAQLYYPQLETPYSVSLQDQLNANQADFNSMQRQAGYSPAAAASLAAQKYAANSQVLGQQERLNTAAKMEAYNRNRNTLNDAQLKNLGILDTQYQRQAQAKSNTKEQALTALDSIASKIAQNKLENRKLGVLENMYNYRYDKNGRAINYNAPENFQTENLVANNSADLLPIYDASGKKITGYKASDKTTPDNKTKKDKEVRNGSIVKAFKHF